MSGRNLQCHVFHVNETRARGTQAMDNSPYWIWSCEKQSVNISERSQLDKQKEKTMDLRIISVALFQPGSNEVQPL